MTALSLNLWVTAGMANNFSDGAEQAESGSISIGRHIGPHALIEGAGTPAETQGQSADLSSVAKASMIGAPAESAAPRLESNTVTSTRTPAAAAKPVAPSAVADGASTNVATPTAVPDNRTPPSARSGRTESQQQDDFLAEAIQAARDSRVATGVPASVTIAQAILESNWGKSTIGANNYFGIKATSGPGPAGIVWAATKEYTTKGWTTVQAPFRAYDNMAQSFTDHGKFLIENPRYSKALQQAGDPKLFAKLLQQAGYATDPGYATSLVKLMDRFSLYQYDQP